MTRQHCAMITLTVALAGCGGAVEQLEVGTARHPLTGPVLGTFEGSSIDLSKDWGAARSCLVWHERGVVDCFRTDDEMAIREVELNTVSTSGRLPSDPTTEAACGSYSHLWEHANKGGRHLQFRDRGYWQNLTNYSFNDMTTSAQAGACRLWVAVDTGGRGTQGYFNAGVYSPNVGDLWNDRISSIYIQ